MGCSRSGRGRKTTCCQESWHLNMQYGVFYIFPELSAAAHLIPLHLCASQLEATMKGHHPFSCNLGQGLRSTGDSRPAGTLILQYMYLHLFVFCPTAALVVWVDTRTCICVSGVTCSILVPNLCVPLSDQFMFW